MQLHGKNARLEAYVQLHVEEQLSTALRGCAAGKALVFVGMVADV